MKKNGFINQTVGGVVTLIVGTAVATLTLIFTGVLGGQTYNLAETDINNISDTTIKGYVTDSIKSSFKAQAQVGNYLPLIVLAVVITLIMALILSMTALGGMAGGSRSAL